MRFGGWLVVGAAAVTLAAPGWAQRKPPYFVSLKADKANMRTGPGRNYPASWTYRRKGLPLKVVDIYGEWRKVEDPGGTQGWMLRAFLDEARRAMIMGSVVEMRAAPQLGAKVNWRAAPGVVGTIGKCADNWCWFDVNGRAGYVEQSRLWGTEPGEVVN
jgi:SH3-like domain-containing protein